MRALILAAFVAASAAPALARTPPAPPIPAPPQAGPAETVEAFHRALDAGDGPAAIALMAEDALVFEQGYVERTRAEYIEKHLEADMAFSKAVPSTVISRKATAVGDIAWVVSEGAVKGEFQGKPVDRLTLETIVLRREGGVWKIVHIHWSSRAAPGPGPAA